MKFKPTRSMSAAELMARLQSDEDFVRKNEEREAQQRAVEAQLRADETPLVSELAEVGVRVSSVWDLVNANWSYAAALPVLTKHLRLPYHPKIREGIARALTVREARGVAGREILQQLQREADQASEVRWALANALTEAADLSMLHEIKAIAADARYKDISTILTLAIKNMSI